jgi:hypothetical protein
MPAANRGALQSAGRRGRREVGLGCGSGGHRRAAPAGARYTGQARAPTRRARVQAVAVLAIAKPLGLCGEPFTATPNVRVFGRKWQPPPTLADKTVDSRMPRSVRWFFT